MKGYEAELKKALGNYLDTDPEIKHKADYFRAGFSDASAGYFDEWYCDKKAYGSYLAGSKAGRVFAQNGLAVIG